MAHKIGFKTIGCKVNQYETGALRQLFINNGYNAVRFDENADIYIINTCAVTKEAERKSKQMIRKASRLNPEAFIIVTGCAVQSNFRDIKECSNVSLIVGNYYKEDIFNIIRKISKVEKEPQFFTSSADKITNYIESKCFSSSNRIRRPVKIQDGCNQFCSYCIIPYLRGRARSRSAEQILSEIKDLGEKGYKEIVLLGINLGSYGSDLNINNSKINLANLIAKIVQVSTIERIRLSSIELPYVDKELINTFRYYPKLCHHLHIPLQSGDNRVLSLMNRRYTSEQYNQTIASLKRQIPDIALTTDIIVGFPGEDETAFQNTIDMVRKIGFSKVHVFPYSERMLSLASFLPDKVEAKVIKDRSKRLIDLSKQLTREYLEKNLGEERDVLIESKGQENELCFASGLTDNYIKVFLYNTSYEKGQIVKTKIVQTSDNYAVGKPAL